MKYEGKPSAPDHRWRKLRLSFRRVQCSHSDLYNGEFEFRGNDRRSSIAGRGGIGEQVERGVDS